MVLGGTKRLETVRVKNFVLKNLEYGWSIKSWMNYLLVAFQTLERKRVWPKGTLETGENSEACKILFFSMGILGVDSTIRNL